MGLVNGERFLRRDGSILVGVVFRRKPFLKVIRQRFSRNNKFLAGYDTVAILSRPARDE